VYPSPGQEFLTIPQPGQVGRGGAALFGALFFMSAGFFGNKFLFFYANIAFLGQIPTAAKPALLGLISAK
jgi:hypothetical protein